MERAPDEPAARRAAESWFAARGWQPFDFQRRVWAAMAAGRSGLLHASTGAGKTYAVWLGALGGILAQVALLVYEHVFVRAGQEVPLS